MFCFSALRFFIYLSFRAVVSAFEPFCPVDTVLLFTVFTVLYLCSWIKYSFIHCCTSTKSRSNVSWVQQLECKQKDGRTRPIAVPYPLSRSITRPVHSLQLKLEAAIIVWVSSPVVWEQIKSYMTLISNKHPGNKITFSDRSIFCGEHKVVGYRPKVIFCAHGTRKCRM